MQKKSRFIAPLVFLAGLSGVMFGGSTSATAQPPDPCERGCFRAHQRCLQRTRNEVQCRVGLNQCLRQCDRADDEGEER